MNTMNVIPSFDAHDLYDWVTEAHMINTPLPESLLRDINYCLHDPSQEEYYEQIVSNEEFMESLDWNNGRYRGMSAQIAQIFGNAK